MPKACVDSPQVVDCLADASSYSGAFDPKRAKPLDVERVIAVLDEAGVRMQDVNDGSDEVYSVETIARQLAKRRGDAYRRLMHLGYIYAKPIQYSKVSCSISGNTIVVMLTRWYRLTFRRVESHFNLTHVEYLEREGD